jgi:hypothetical protein
MNETGKNDFIIKKSYEISYALWRIAANIKERGFAGRLIGKSAKLLDAAVTGNLSEILEVVAAIEFFIKFGVDVNAINVSNGDIILREIGNLKSAIPSINTAIADLDIAGIFSEELPETPEAEEIGDTEETKIEIESDDFKPISIAANAMKSEMRQSMILEKIRQIGNCRLNDIQAILPDTSERTIRYDLEALVQKGVIERIGVGGRGVYYRAK